MVSEEVYTMAYTITIRSFQSLLFWKWYLKFSHVSLGHTGCCVSILIILEVVSEVLGLGQVIHAFDSFNPYYSGSGI